MKRFCTLFTKICLGVVWTFACTLLTLLLVLFL